MPFRINYQIKRKLARISALVQTTWRNWRLNYQFLKGDIYDFSQSANPYIRTASFSLIILALITVLIPVLFQSIIDVDAVLEWLEPLVLLSFGSLFIFRSGIEPQPFQFIKSRKFEAFAALFAIILGFEIVFDGGIISYIQLEHWGIPHPKHFTLLLVEYYLIVLIIIKVIQYTPVVIVAMELLNAGVKEVYARANSDVQEQILKRIGITEVIHPERQVGERMGITLHRRGMKDLLELGEGLSVIEILVPKSMHGYTLAELELRKRFGVNVLTVNHPFQTENTETVEYKSLGFVEPTTKLQKGDKMVVLGGINECAKLVELD